MRVTALIENSRLEGRDDLEPEFGLSLYVEREGTRILFDTGASGAFLHNAKTMGIDIKDVDVAVVSHQHFDHGGGLEDFFAANARATVYLRESPRADRYFKALAVIKKPIGIDLDLLDRFSERIEFVDGMRVVAPGVYLLTAIGSAHRRPRGNNRLFVETNGGLVPDSFDHELVMVVHEDDGMVVFSGCSHHGILNIIDAAPHSFRASPSRRSLAASTSLVCRFTTRWPPAAPRSGRSVARSWRRCRGLFTPATARAPRRSASSKG